MHLVETIKSMVDNGYVISFSKADFPVNGIYITIKKDGINTRKIISKDELASLHLLTDEMFAISIEQLEKTYHYL